MRPGDVLPFISAGEARVVESGRQDAVVMVGSAVEPAAAHAIRGVLLEYPGSWRVAVDRELVGGWWLVTLSAEGFHHSVLVPPREQSAEQLRSVVVETISARVRPVHLARHEADPRPSSPRPREAGP
jgi:hypothetical protein